MIVNWTKTNVKIIPCLGSNGQIVGEVTLLPGMNEIPDDQWALARSHIKDELERGLIKEIKAEVKMDEVKNESTGKVEKKTVIKSKALKDLSVNEAIEIVKETVNLKTLKDWEKKESRDSVRLEIKNQIDNVEKYGEDKKKIDNSNN